MFKYTHLVSISVRCQSFIQGTQYGCQILEVVLQFLFLKAQNQQLLSNLTISSLLY